MQVYPSIEELISGEDNDNLLEFKRAPISLFPLFFWAGVFVVLIISLMSLLEQPALRWLAILPVGLLLESLRRFHNDVYTLGLHKLVNYHGKLSLSYSVPTVKYAHIRSIAVNQSVWGRMFSFGDVVIQTAAQDGAEMIVEGVPAPEELAALIEDLRNNSQRMQESGDPDAEFDHSVNDRDE